MVLGGIASRRELSFDALDDLQLAVDSLIAEDGGREPLTMTVAIQTEGLTVTLYPLQGPDLRETLRLGAVPAGAHCMDVCVLLRSLVDGYGVRDLESGEFAVDMRKAVR